MSTIKEICEETLALNGYILGKSKGKLGTEIVNVPVPKIRGMFLDKEHKDSKKRISDFLQKMSKIEGRWWVDFATKDGKYTEVNGLNLDEVFSAIDNSSIEQVQQMIKDGYNQITIGEEKSIQRRNIVVSQFNTTLESQRDLVVVARELFGFRALGYWESVEVQPYSGYSGEHLEMGHSEDYTSFYGDDLVLSVDEIEKIDGRIYEDNEDGDAIREFWESEDINVDYIDKELDPNGNVAVFHRKRKDWYVSPVVEEEEIEFAFYDSVYRKRETEVEYIYFVQVRDLEAEKRVTLEIERMVEETKERALFNGAIKEDEDSGLLHFLGIEERYEARELIDELVDECSSQMTRWEIVKGNLFSVDENMISSSVLTGKKFTALAKLHRLAKLIGGDIRKTNLVGSTQEAWCLKKDDQEFHFDLPEFLFSIEQGEDTIRGFLKRADKAINSRGEVDSEVLKNASSVFVSIEDSIIAGNCKTGTMEMVRRMKINPAVTGGIRGDVLLEKRDDAFTRRAVDRALSRVNK